MKKLSTLLLASIFIPALSGCTSTFGGTVLVLNFRDIMFYVIIALVISGLLAFTTPSEKRRKTFLIWFVVSLIITPLPGLIYFMIKITKKKEQ